MVIFIVEVGFFRRNWEVGGRRGGGKVGFYDVGVKFGSGFVVYVFGGEVGIRGVEFCVGVL